MAITVTTPSDYQISQRDGNDLADITITGTYTGSPVAIEASFNGGAYQTIDAAPSGGTFSGTLTDQDAGQGTLTVRFTDTPATLDTVAYVGIGDVFAVMGQSNAAGFGDNNQVYSHATLKASMWKLDVGSWGELLDPTGIIDTGGTQGKGSVWPIVATRHMASQGVPVGFITVAVGGTGLASTGQWAQGGAQYEDALAEIAASGVNDVKAILWFQGEDEVQDGISQTAYQTALSLMLDNMQADSPVLAGVKLMAGQIGDRNGEPREDLDAIRLAIQNRWNNDADILPGPLTYDINLDDGDQVHFGSGSDSELTTLANRWWRMISYYFFSGSQGRAPRFSGATRSGTQVTVTFTGGVSPLTGQTSIIGWRFTDNGTPISVVSAAASGTNGVVLTLASEPTGLGLLSFGSSTDAHDTLLLDSGTYPMPPEPFVNQATTGSVSLGDSFSATYDPAFGFYVDIEDSSGTKVGSGPLQTISKWRYTARMDRAGTIDFEVAANDAQIANVTNRAVVRAHALLNGTWTEVGAGVIDTLSVVPGSDGAVSLQASGLDLIRELSYRGVGQLEIGSGTGATHNSAIQTIGALAPDGWSFTPADDPYNDYIYARYDGESVLGALVYLANATQTHFYRSSNRTLVFASEFTSSGVRAIQASGYLAAQTCAISSLRQTVDTKDLLTRIYPYGSGTGQARLTLAATSRTAPSGYTLNKTSNYIENTSATTTYGLIDFPQIEFKEITPIENTAANVRSAANMLFDAALRELTWRSTLASQRTYDLTIENCSQLLRPLQTIRVIYKDVDQGIDIDEDLYILEATWELGTNEIRTSRLVVSTDDRWPESDESAAAERAVQGRVFAAHPQMGPNEWWENGTLFVGTSQTDHIAEYPFVLGNAIVTVQQVLLRYKVEQILTFTSVVAGSVDVAVTVDAIDVDVDVSVSGTIDISHTHSLPTHQHSFTIIGNGAGALTYDIGYGAGGTAGGIRHNIGSTDHVVSTNAISGTTTVPSGGSASLALSGTGSGTGTGTGSGAIDLSDAINVGYGVYRAPASRTYAIDDLEYAVNGGAWADLGDGVATGDDYYEIDITEEIQDPDTFRPYRENNLIEIRRKSGASSLTINSSQGDGTTVGISTGVVEHGLTVGEIVTISGTTHHNGTYSIVEITNEFTFRVNQSGDSNTEGAVGSVEITKSAMVFVKLGVRSTIQAVALT